MFFASSAVRSSSQASSSGAGRHFAGILAQKDDNGKTVSSKRIYTGHELIIGRDGSRCQYVIDEPVVSNKHIRIYTVVYEEEKPSEVPPLVYAEDLSRNGTYWNGSLIGKGNGGFLLSDGDTLRISAKVHFSFKSCAEDLDKEMFDLVQEQEMKRFESDYIVTDRLLGSGAFGKVFMAIEQGTRTQLACKVVDLRKLRPQSRARIGRLEQPAAAEDVDSRIQLRKLKALVDLQNRDNRLEEKLKIYYREAEILAPINHPNIIGLEKVYMTDNTMYMFQELVTAGDLFSYLEHKNGKLLEVEVAAIIRQVLIALEFLHEKKIIHRDLKPDNVLMTSLAAGSRVVLTDFGAARSISNGQERMSTLVGTVGYTAPEVLGRPKMPVSRKGYTRAVDMWSLGCLTFLLLTGGLAFVDPRTDEYSEQLAYECDLASLDRSPEWQQVRPRPKEFVRKLLIADEQDRMSAKDALQHPWFSNELHKTNFEDLYQRTVRHWRPRILRQPVIEFADAESIRRLPCSQGILEAGKKPRRKYHMPVEPPYKPFPRNMHTPLFPKRASGLRTLSEEVRAAIKEKWNFKGNSDASSESDGETLPPLTPPSARAASKPLVMRSKVSRDNRDAASQPASTLPVTPGSRPFKPLHPKTPLSTSDESKRAKGDGKPESVTKLIDQPHERLTKSRGSRSFSPSAWNDGDNTLRPSAEANTQLNRPFAMDRPGTPRPFSGDRSGGDFPPRPLVDHQEQPASAERQGSRDDSPAEIVDAFNATGQSQTRTFLEHNSNLQQGDHADPVSPQRTTPGKANTKLKLKSLSLLQRGQSNTPNTKKRRRGSVFEIDDHVDVDATGSNSKKPRADWQTAKTFSMKSGGEGREIWANHASDASSLVSSKIGTRDATSETADNQLYLPRL